MPSVSDYEKQRQENIEQNRKVLKELGLLNPFQCPIFAPKPVTAVFKPNKSKKSERPPKRRKIESFEQVSEENSENLEPRRRSNRLQGKPIRKFDGLSELADDGSDNDYEYSDDSDNDEHYTRKRMQKPHIVVPKGRENVFGAIPNVPVGKCWMMRIECSFDGIHRPLVAGIHGNAKGCYSIALSGGYEDDLDYGEWFTYTGAGGRDLKGTKNKPKNLRTAPQSKDQTLDGANLSLSKNVETKQPVRVIRGFKLKSQYAPKEGYRYDGLYTVEKFWFTTGLSGFGIYKFALKRCENQDPPPWSYKTDSKSTSESEISTPDEQKDDDEKNNNVPHDNSVDLKESKDGKGINENQTPAENNADEVEEKQDSLEASTESNGE